MLNSQRPILDTYDIANIHALEENMAHSNHLLQLADCNSWQENASINHFG